MCRVHAELAWHDAETRCVSATTGRARRGVTVVVAAMPVCFVLRVVMPGVVVCRVCGCI